ncbi:unnamed protein product [Caenorhabditis angaria]|uniref:MSP domain-containing protein n=1 Tax=Caenorhabditis angaria TaxID=860376 RepID=A0A9P1N1Q5_9PELO|nr:unnamed protein product [Caenorhabditis angaria]
MAQSVPPGDIQTQPNAKIVFNAPYDDKHTYHIKVINSSARRIGYMDDFPRPKSVEKTIFSNGISNFLSSLDVRKLHDFGSNLHRKSIFGMNICERGKDMHLRRIGHLPYQYWSSLVAILNYFSCRKIINVSSEVHLLYLAPLSSTDSTIAQFFFKKIQVFIIFCYFYC